MNPVTVSPLHKHHGQHGGLIALGLLVVSIVVVWSTHSQRSAPAPAPPIVAPPAGASVAEVSPPLEPVATAVVGERSFRGPVIATGFATYDEHRTARIAVPVHGWLQKVRASSTGRRVRPGETLAVIYSPEVFLASADLIAQVREFESQEPLDRARARLLRWGMQRHILERIERTQKPEAGLPLVARVGGTVVTEQGEPGQFVEPSGSEYFTITDPANVWVYVELPDADAERARVGTPARLTVEGVARPVTTKVAYVWRRSENGMRTVRFDVHSPRAAIQPSAVVKAEVQLPPLRALAVPAAAVVRTDGPTSVFVVRDGSLEARDVTLGPLEAGFYRIDRGLVAGETVALGTQQC